MKLFPKIGLCIQAAKTLKRDLSDTFFLCQSFGKELHLLVSPAAGLDKPALEKVMQELDPGSLSIKINFIEAAVSEGILDLSKKEKLDLLIVPALRREGLIRYYTGSLARQLVQWADCSVLLIKPSKRIKAKSYRNLVCNLNHHPKSAHTLYTAREIAQGLQIHPWHVALHSSEQDDYQYFEPIRAKVSLPEDSVKLHRLKQRTGYSLNHSAEKYQADILLINSPDTKLGYNGRLIGDDLEYLFSELPSDLLLVHSFDDPKFR